VGAVCVGETIGVGLVTVGAVVGMEFGVELGSQDVSIKRTATKKINDFFKTTSYIYNS
jgi:hypothetical protein